MAVEQSLVPQAAQPSALATLVQDVYHELAAMTGMDLFRRQHPIGIGRQALLFAQFSNAFSARRDPREQHPIACGQRTRQQPFLKPFNASDDAFHLFAFPTPSLPERLEVLCAEQPDRAIW